MKDIIKYEKPILIQLGCKSSETSIGIRPEGDCIIGWSAGGTHPPGGEDNDCFVLGKSAMN